MPTSLNVTIEDTVINGTTTVVVDIADENGYLNLRYVLYLPDDRVSDECLGQM